MTLSRTEWQKKSDDKRGVQAKTYKLPTALVQQIEQLAKQHNLPQSKIIEQAITLFVQHTA